ncbi:hypothetical protein H2198_006132 [Neophaeococcomyces mojaviensis]|uniref:Uncharacterized protein n=1 Tax=Neophaeococcomyces mojaviensis TaxID=3383035 RepID=A0ACC3A3P1_9EURO|nr:hypothetical protein H2198_006132 [Knufia sp. JES_112]
MSKRQNARSDSGRSRRNSKRVRLTVPELPQEILDIILSYTIDLPNQPHHGDHFENLTLDMFNNPFLHVNHYFRETVLNTIAYKCIWVEIRIHEKKHRELLEDLDRYVCELPKFWDSLVPQDRPTLTFELGRETLSIRTTREFVKSKKRLIFPYNFQSFIKIVAKLRPTYRDRVLHPGALRSLTIQCSGVTGKVRRVLDDEILSIVRMLRFIPNLRFADSSICTPEQLVAMSTDLCNVQTFHQDVKYIWETITRFEEAGMIEEARCISLYLSDKLRQDGAFALRRPETLVLLLGRPGWENDTLLQMRMSAVRVFFQIHHHAYEALSAFIERDSRWAVKQMVEYDLRWSQWQEQPRFTWFGLPDSDMAKVNYMVAVTSMRQPDFGLRDLVGDERRKRSWYYEAVNLFKHAIQSASCAMELDQSCDEYQQLRAALLVLGKALYNIEEAADLIPQKHNYTDVDNEARTIVGEPWRGRKWAHLEHELLYLPRAQALALRGFNGN